MEIKLPERGKKLEWACEVEQALYESEIRFTRRGYCHTIAGTGKGIPLVVKRIEGETVFVQRHDTIRGRDLHKERPDIVAEDGMLLVPHELYLCAPAVDENGNRRLGDSFYGRAALYALINPSDVGYHPCWEEAIEVVEQRFEPLRQQRQRKRGEKVTRVPVVSGPPAALFAKNWDRVFGTDRLYVPRPDHTLTGDDCELIERREHCTLQ